MNQYKRVPKDLILRECLNIFKHRLKDVRRELLASEKDTADWIPQNREVLLQSLIGQRDRYEKAIRRLESLELKGYQAGDPIGSSAVLAVQNLKAPDSAVIFHFVVSGLGTGCEFSLGGCKIVVGEVYNTSRWKPGDEIAIFGPHDAVVATLKVIDLY